MIDITEDKDNCLIQAKYQRSVIDFPSTSLTPSIILLYKSPLTQRNILSVLFDVKSEACIDGKVISYYSSYTQKMDNTLIADDLVGFIKNKISYGLVDPESRNAKIGILITPDKVETLFTPLVSELSKYINNSR